MTRPISVSCQDILNNTQVLKCKQYHVTTLNTVLCNTGPIFCLLLGVSSDYSQPITGQVTEVTCPVIDQSTAWAYSEQETENGPWTQMTSWGILLDRITEWVLSVRVNVNDIISLLHFSQSQLII